MEFNLLEFMSSSGLLVIETYSQMFDFLNFGLEIDGVDYSILGILLTGGGLIAFITYTVIKWIL